MRPSVRTTAVVLSAAAVVVAAGALFFLQYRSLVQLEEKTRVTVHDELVRAAQSVGRAVESGMEPIATDALGRMKAGDLQANVIELGRQFDAIKRTHPEIEQIFLLATGPEGSSAAVSARSGAEKFT